VSITSRLVAVTALLGLVIGLSVTPAHAQGDDVRCVTTIQGERRCAYVIYSDVRGEDGQVAVTCDPDSGEPCWIEKCRTHEANDASRFGMAWTGSNTDRPLKLDDIHFGFGDEPDPYLDTYYNGMTTTGAAGSVHWFSESGSWWTCTTVDGNVDEIDQLLPGNAGDTTWGPTGPLIDLAALRGAAEAGARPELPPARKSTPDGVASIVKVPTWMWIEPGYWVEREGSDSSPSRRLTVVVTAEPIDTLWETGEGQLADCEEGTPFVPGSSDADDPRACSWEYSHSTGWNGAPYRLEVTAHWFFSWEMQFNTGLLVDQGPLLPDPDYYPANGWDIEVEEVLAVAGGGG